MNTDIAILGGGPAGFAAALSAYKEGITDIIILERDFELGGILPQCIGVDSCEGGLESSGFPPHVKPMLLQFG